MTESIISIILGSLTLLLLHTKRFFPAIQNRALLICQVIVSLCFCAMGLYHLLADIMAYYISRPILTEQGLMANLCDLLVITLGVVILNDTILSMNDQKYLTENQSVHWMINPKQFMLSVACLLAGLYEVYSR